MVKATAPARSRARPVGMQMGMLVAGERINSRAGAGRPAPGTTPRLLPAACLPARDRLAEAWQLVQLTLLKYWLPASAPFRRSTASAAVLGARPRSAMPPFSLTSALTLKGPSSLRPCSAR